MTTPLRVIEAMTIRVSAGHENGTTVPLRVAPSAYSGALHHGPTQQPKMGGGAYCVARPQLGNLTYELAAIGERKHVAVQDCHSNPLGLAQDKFREEPYCEPRCKGGLSRMSLGETLLVKNLIAQNRLQRFSVE